MSKKLAQEKNVLVSHDKVKAKWNLINLNIKGRKDLDIRDNRGLTDIKKAKSNNEAANLFNHHFTDLSEMPRENSQIKLPDFHHRSMFVNEIDIGEFHKHVRNLKNKKSSGYDAISASVI